MVKFRCKNPFKKITVEGWRKDKSSVILIPTIFIQIVSVVNDKLSAINKSVIDLRVNY